MATSLSRQLLKLKVPESQASRKSLTPSLLFEPKIAATFDKDTFYALGANGFQELCQLDSSFHDPYYDELFSEVAADIERSVKSKEFNNKLDITIDSFLIHLSPYFLLRPAQKCIEWLLHRFDVHLFNAESMLKCSFPYYGTNLFVRVVQLLDTKHLADKWKDIIATLVDGTPMSLSDVISYSLANTWFLEFFCNSVLESVKKSCSKNKLWRTRGWINLFTSTFLGVIHNSTKIKESFLHTVMPVISKGIQSNLADFQASCFMVVSQLLVKVNLSLDALDMIVRLTTKYCVPQLQKDAVFMIALLFHLQRHYEKLQKRAFRRLTSWECLLNCIVSLSSNKNGDKFMEVFFSRLVPQTFVVAGTDACSSGDSDNEFHPPEERYQYLLQSVVDETNLSRNVQDCLFDLVLRNYGKHAGKTNAVVNEILHRIQKKYSEAFDKALSICTQSTKLSDEVLQKFLTVSLASLKHQLLEDSHMMLTFAITHPESSIRLQAINRLNTVFQSDEYSEESKTFALNSVCNILTTDDDPYVIEETLSLLSSHLSIFVEPSGKIFEETLKMVEAKSDNEKFSTSVQKGVEFLVHNCSTIKETVFKEKRLLFRDKTSLLLIHFALHRVLKPSLDESLDIATSDLVKESSFFSELYQSSGSNHEELVNNLTKILSKPENQAYFIELCSMLEHCQGENFYVPVSMLLIQAGICTGNQRLFLKSLNLLISLTQSFSFSNSMSKLMLASDSFLEILPKIKQETKFAFKHQLICQAILLLWKDVMNKLPGSFSLSYDYFLPLQPNPLNEINESKTMQSLFLLMIDMMSYAGSEEAVEFIQEIFCLFIVKMFATPIDILHFLAAFWLSFLQEEWEGKTQSFERFVATLRLALNLFADGRKAGGFFQVDSGNRFVAPQYFIPSLLLSCTSTNETIRSCAVQVVENLTLFKRCPHGTLLKQLTRFAKEIRMDSKYVVEVIAQCFCANANKEKTTKDLSKLINQCVIKPLDSNQIYFALKFYEKCLIKVESPAEFKVIIPCFEKLLNKCIEMSLEVSRDKCSLMALWLRKIVNSSAALNRENLFLKALQCSPEHLKEVDDISLVPQLVALNLLKGKFFASVSYQSKSKILGSLICIKADASDEPIQQAAFKAFKYLTVADRLVLDQLKELGILQQPATQRNIIQAKRAELQQAASGVKGVAPLAWKRFVVLLEFLHHKKRIQHSENLIGPFFDLLNDLTEKKHAVNNLDYVILLVLGCLLNFFDRAKTLDSDVLSRMKENVKVELLVRCIHSTHNPQTHQHALMLLAKMAHYCPEKVLHSVMSIFTFMGSTILRRDDSYSFQIITQTIKTIIPSLMQMENKRGLAADVKLDAVLGILRVFVDSLPYIPSHRRLTVFEELLGELGPDVYLWQLMVLLVDQHVTQLSKSAKDGYSEESHSYDDAASKMEESLSMWTSICQLFSLGLRIKSVVDILTFLKTFINQLNGKEKPTVQKSPLIDLSKRSTNQMRRFHVVMLTLTSYIVRNIKSSSNEKRDEEESVDNLLESALIYLDHVNLMGEKGTDKSDVAMRYQKTIMRRVNDILEKINSMLPLGTFFNCLYKLLDIKSIAERGFILQKLIQLFHRRVLNSGIKFTREQERGLLKLGGRFIAMLKENCCSIFKNEASLHTAALGLTHIVRLIGQKNPKEFVATQPIICDVIESKALSNNVLSSLLACLGEVVINLKAHSIGNLKRLCSCFISLLADAQIHPANSVYVSLLTTVNKLFSCLGHFLSPHIEDFMIQLCVLHYAKLQTVPKQTSSSSETLTKPAQKRPKSALSPDPPPHQLAANVLEQMADKVAARVWVPLLQPAYEKIQNKHPLAVKSLLTMAGHHVRKFSSEDLTQHAAKLTDFYLNAMNFRNKFRKMTAKEIESVERESLDGAIALLLKLPETTFRPLYLKLYDWGCSDNVSLPQSVTFYRCTSLMAAKLKNLFEIFASDLLEDMCEELKESPMELCKSAAEENELISKQSYVLDTLGSMLNFSSPNLLSQEIFESILQPLLQQIANVLTSTSFQTESLIIITAATVQQATYSAVKNSQNLLLLEIVLSDRSRSDAYVTKHVIKCVGYLAGASGDNISWRPLNYEILMKTRHDSPNIRCYALECLKVCVENLSENYLVQLPETIPFLAELLEDESNEVESCCQRVIKRMEEVLGEPLQKYF